MMPFMLPFVLTTHKDRLLDFCLLQVIHKALRKNTISLGTNSTPQASIILKWRDRFANLRMDRLFNFARIFP